MPYQWHHQRDGAAVGAGLQLCLCDHRGVVVGLAFPFEPAQTAITTLTVGLRTGPQGQTKRRQAKAEPLMRVLVRFVLPVAIWSMLVGVAVYTYVYFRTSQVLTSETVPAEVITTFEQATGLTYQASQTFGLTAARIQAQTARSVFLSFSALLLILFWSRQSRGWPSGVRLVRIPPYLAGAGSDGLVCDQLIYACGFQLFRRYSAARTFCLAGYWARAHAVGRGLWLFWRHRWLDRLLTL